MGIVLGLRQRVRRLRWRMGRWLSLGAVLLALALALPAAALAHEHRTVHGYELTVGFNVEPAYVGQINGVFLQVMKQAAPGAEGHDGGHGEHAHAMVAAGANMAVAVAAEADPFGGVNVHIMPTGFKFTPENANGPDVPGEGHAHVYVDGEKVERVYTPWFHLTDIAPGMHTVRVTLNANSHGDHAVQGQIVEATTQVNVPEATTQAQGEGRQVAADGHMSVAIMLEPDPLGGANLTVVPHGFAFAAQNVNKPHVSGEGYARVYVNGVAIGRLYGPAMHLGNLTQGMNEVRVTLNANTHEDYTVNSQVVQATATVHVEQGDATDGNKEGDDGHTHAAMVPVEGLEATLTVLVAAGGSEPREFPLRAVYGAPGAYVADFVPTRTGSYIFTFTGTIEGNPINERFESGPGRFDDVRPITTIQFPEPLPSSTELQEELTVARAAIGTAQALAFGGLGAGAIAVLAAGMAMLMASRRR